MINSDENKIRWISWVIHEYITAINGASDEITDRLFKKYIGSVDKARSLDIENDVCETLEYYYGNKRNVKT